MNKYRIKESLEQVAGGNVRGVRGRHGLKIPFSTCQTSSSMEHERHLDQKCSQHSLG